MPDKQRTFSEIDDEEWDFRPLAEGEVRTALEYEYLRSCKPVAESLSKWKDTPVEDLSTELWQLLPENIRNLLRDGIQTPIGIVARAAWTEFPMGSQRDHFLMTIAELLPEPVVKRGGRDIALMFGGIDSPWMEIRKHRGFLPEITRLPPVEFRAFHVARLDEIETLALSEDSLPSISKYVVEIDWTQPQKVRSQFSEWLRETISRLERKPRATPFTLLQNLAAHRLKQVHVSFVDFEKANMPKHPGPKLPVQPPNKSSEWYRAAGSAKSLLQHDFILRIRQICA